MQEPYSILVVDDDRRVREMLQEILVKHFTVYTATHGQEGIEIARQKLPHLVLMDLKMPHLDGLSACEMLRKDLSTRHIPVMVLTAVDDLDRRVLAFEAGADDFILKPFQPRELIARILAKLRRIEELNDPPHPLVCGNLKLLMERYEVEVDQALIPLSVLEFDLLKFFVQHPNEVHSRERILSTVWKDSTVTDRTVDTHIAALRRKLKGFNHQFGSVYSAGYILKPMVHEPSSDMKNPVEVRTPVSEETKRSSVPTDF